MNRRAIIIALLACVTAFGAQAITPRIALSDQLPALDLAALVPEQAGEWRVDPNVPAAVVNPQQDFAIQAIYNQTLSRTYVNARGDRIMLSIAYGSDQRDGVQVHMPEVCYPAQGFLLKSVRIDSLALAGGEIPVKRVETMHGNARPEPVTYWMTVGEDVVVNGKQKKLAELRYSIRGVYPDGLLFRVSTISRDSAAAYRMQDDFLRTIVAAIDPEHRPRFAGRGSIE